LIRTFKYRIYANKETIANLETWIYLCRNLYNCALSERIYAWKMQRKTVSGYEQCNELPELKKIYEEYKQVNAQVLQQVLERLANSYKAYFKHRKGVGDKRVGYPRYKGISRYKSITLKSTGWKIIGKYLFIKKVGKFKLKLSRPIQGVIRNVTIKKTPTGKWYVYFSCGSIPEVRLEKINNIVGLDMGVEYYLTDSKGIKKENPKYLKKKIKELRVKNRALARAKFGSNRRKKAKLRLSKCHEIITNQRNDFLHKLSTRYIKDYDTIVIEDLAISNLMKNHNMSRNIIDCAWGQFFRLLNYKAEEAGRTIVKVGRLYPSSKICSSCGEVNRELKLSNREWVCMKCGTIHNRDINAAINLERFGQNHQTLTYSSG
jgi:putative transposase